MTVRTIRIATAAAAAALGLVAISLPAFAEGPAAPKPGEPPTTIKVEAPKPPTTAKPSGGVEVTGYLRTLISKVEAAQIEPGAKGALLTRLRSARDAFVNGQTVDNATMQALINDVRNALGAPPTSDRHEPTTLPSADKPPTTDGPGSSGDTGTAGNTGDAGKGRGGKPGKLATPGTNDNATIIRLLDSAVEKVNASNLSDADRAALLDQIGAVRAKVDAGTPLGHEELGQLLTGIRKALGNGEHATTGSTEPESDGHGKGSGTPKNRALSALEREIERITKSDLPADVKTQLLAALNAAKDQLASGSDAPGAATDIRKVIEDHRSQRHAELVGKLTTMSDKIAQYIDRVAQQPGTGDAVAAAKAKLDQAKALLTPDATPQDLRTAWQLLRQIRIDLKGLAHPEGTTVPTAAPPAGTPGSVEPAQS